MTVMLVEFGYLLAANIAASARDVARIHSRMGRMPVNVTVIS